MKCFFSDLWFSNVVQTLQRADLLPSHMDVGSGEIDSGWLVFAINLMLVG
jgi:hypothetical protein